MFPARRVASGFLSSITIMSSLVANMVGLLPTMVPMGFFQGMSSPATPSSHCRCLPGDSCWPDRVEWENFNRTVGGKLISTVPIAAVCHEFAMTTAAPNVSLYNADACATLDADWFLPQTHIPSSSSAQAYLFTNNSCNPFSAKNDACTLGNYVSYSVNATAPADVQQTAAFAAENNIRLVIRNTGHDYNGKSTGAGGLAIWLHSLNSITLSRAYTSAAYSGRAVKVGAGVSIYDAYLFADAHGGIIVGGDCPTVSLAGGYTQGGGHGPLSSKFGLGADQVLEWEVVTATGQLLTASPTQHSDLYWALCGGGGGTYGIVTAMTVKLHDTLSVASANLTFAVPDTPTGSDDFWDVVHTFAGGLPSMVDAGIQVIWTIFPGAFSVSPATGPGVSKSTMDGLFSSTLTKLAQHNITYQYVSSSYPTYLAAFNAMNLPSSEVGNTLIGGRFVPRSVINNNLDGFIAAIRSTVETYFNVFAGITINVANKNTTAVAVNPPWRSTIVSAVMGSLFNYSDFQSNFANQNLLTNTIIPTFSHLSTVPPGAYLNEADFQEPNWKSVFYGSNYQALDKVKAKYDPYDMLYALGAVGSDRWTQLKDGRLCRT
jgi:hypothetical protein